MGALKDIRHAEVPDGEASGSSASPLGPPSPASSPAVARVMKSNRAAETAPEISLRKALREVGLPGYRKNWKGVSGRLDIAYPGKRLAVFVHGCFWHRCPRCNLPLPKTNTDFWRRKFIRNKERDRRKVKKLEGLGWTVNVFWECQVIEDANGCAQEVLWSYVAMG